MIRRGTLLRAQAANAKIGRLIKPAYFIARGAFCYTETQCSPMHDVSHPREVEYYRTLRAAATEAADYNRTLYVLYGHLGAVGKLATASEVLAIDVALKEVPGAAPRHAKEPQEIKS